MREIKFKNSQDAKMYNEGYEDGRKQAIEEELQSFAQWLWDSHYLVDEAFTIRLVEQYKAEQLKEQKDEQKTSQEEKK